MAAFDNDMGERTEMPTPLRLAEARRKGIVARSGDLSAAATLLAGLILLALTGPAILDGLVEMTAESLASPGDIASLAPGVSIWKIVLPAAGLACGVAFSAAAIGMAQVGLSASAEPIRLDFARLGLLAGLARMISPRSAVRGAMAAAKILAVSAVAWWTIAPMMPRIVSTAGAGAGELASQAGAIFVKLAMRICAVLVALAAIDWLYQRWQHRRDLMITRTQLLQDLRQMEGAKASMTRVRRTKHGITGQRGKG